MAEAFKADYERKYHDRLANDFPFYSRWCLKIRTKPGSLESFIFNKAQEYLHQKVEEQRQATGRVRVLILKGRQQGMSTYIGGRFYWRTTRLPGKSTFILSHAADTTEKLFSIITRFWSIYPNLQSCYKSLITFWNKSSTSFISRTMIKRFTYCN